MTATSKEVKQSTYKEVIGAESFSVFMQERWNARAVEGEHLVIGETTIKVGDSEALTAWIAKKENSTVQFGPFSLSVKKSGVVFTYNGSTILSRAWTTTKQLFGAVWDVLVYLGCKARQGLTWLWNAFIGLFGKKEESNKDESTKAPSVEVAEAEVSVKKS